MCNNLDLATQLRCCIELVTKESFYVRVVVLSVLHGIQEIHASALNQFIFSYRGG